MRNAGPVIRALPVVSLPDPEGPWTDIEEFALGFAPEGGHAELAGMASQARRQWARYGELPGKPSELRACLFFEQRRWNLFGGEPEGRAREYATALVRAIATSGAPDAAEGGSQAHADSTTSDGGLDEDVARAG